MKNREKKKKKMTWGIAVSLLIAFLVGGVAGGLVEHRRLQEDSSKEGGVESGISLQVARDTAADWFGSGNVAACAALQSWTNASAAAYLASGQGRSNWGAAQATLLEQNTASVAALRALLPTASTAGQADIQAILAYDGALGEELADASTVTEFTEAQEALHTVRTKRGFAILGQAVALCPPA